MASRPSTHKKPYKYRVCSLLTSHTSVSSDISSMSTSTTGSYSTSKRIREYPAGHPGPYIVHIKSHDQKINHFQVSTYLCQTIKGIETLKTVTPYLYEVKCYSLAIANNLTNDRNLIQYDVFVPVNQLEAQGIVYFPSNNNQNMLFRCSGFHVASGNQSKILSVYRLNYKRYDEASKLSRFAPSSLVKVNFKGTKLPNYVIINDIRTVYTPVLHGIWSHCTSCRYIRIPVKPYIHSNNQQNSSDDDIASYFSESKEEASTCPNCRKIVRIL